MDNSLQLICSTLKKLFHQLKPKQNPLSFIIITGKSQQGKTTILRQAKLNQLQVELDHDAQIFYNKLGVILELGENWLHRNKNLLSVTCKQLNKCHSTVKISGIILCIDSGELLSVEPSELLVFCKSHAQVLTRFTQNLGYTVPVGILFNKIDALAGFSEFYQSEHQNDIIKPLGFSLPQTSTRQQFIEQFRKQFDDLLETLGQQIIRKLHPARSTTKRTLIREFPLQLANLRIPIQSILQNLPTKGCILQGVFFTSAEQGGISVDRLNTRIEKAYALIVQDKFQQSNNYRGYFIEGTLRHLQRITRYQQPQTIYQYKSFAVSTAAGICLFLVGIFYHHWHTTHLLEKAQKELQSYEAALINDSADNHAAALFHLLQAENTLSKVNHTPFASNSLQQIHAVLTQNTKQQMSDSFLPSLLMSLQTVMVSANESLYDRFQALKIYLMLGDPTHYSEKPVIDWFTTYWSKDNKQAPKNALTLLRKALQQPMQPIPLNQQLVRDMRNYLNALPEQYLYYSLAKKSFSQQSHKIIIPGFNIASPTLPHYYTKEGFHEIIQTLPSVSKEVVLESWVLDKSAQSNLPQLIEEAYVNEYVVWWKNFIQHTQPQHYDSNQKAQELTQLIAENHSIPHLIQMIQQETRPENGTYEKLFNQKIASQFATINLVTNSAIQEINDSVTDLHKFLSTIALVEDKGRTVFELTKARFANDGGADPLSILYKRAHQLPDPIALWAKQIADDTWVMCINTSKNYLNHLWQNDVYPIYQHSIAGRYPFDLNAAEEIQIADFDRFFNPNGLLTQFTNTYIKPFMDTTSAQWNAKELNGYVLPLSENLINELIRANIITKMFFPQNTATSNIQFSLQKIELDPVVANIELTIGSTTLQDNQTTESDTYFNWPSTDAKLSLQAIDGNHFELTEQGPWAFFKILQKVNVLVDNADSASLQILFEVNGNSGRYLLKTQNTINPFSPGVLAGFALNREVV